MISIYYEDHIRSKGGIIFVDPLKFREHTKLKGILTSINENNLHTQFSEIFVD